MRCGRRLSPFVLALVLGGLAFSGQAGLGKARLTGIVKDDDGRPVASAKVVLTFLESERAGGRVAQTPATSRESATFETKTNKRGTWNYVGLAAGTWLVTASAEGYGSASRTCKILQLQDNPRVALVLEKLEQSESNTLAPGLLEKADDLAFRRDFDGAIALYRQYLGQDPEAIMVILAVGDCLMAKGELEAALGQFQVVVDKTSADPRDKPLTARALARMGECSIKKGDTATAVKFWKSSVVLSPLDAEVPFNLGEVLFAEKKLDEAARYYRISAELAPGWCDPFYKLGLVYLSQESYDKARASFRKVVELEPYSPLAFKAREMLKDLDRLKRHAPP